MTLDGVEKSVGAVGEEVSSFGEEDELPLFEWIPDKEDELPLFEWSPDKEDELSLFEWIPDKDESSMVEDLFSISGEEETYGKEEDEGLLDFLISDEEGSKWVSDLSFKPSGGCKRQRVF